MNTKLTKTILLLTLLVLLMGITSATSTPENTTSKVVKETTKTPSFEVQESNVNKEVKKSNKNNKKASENIYVSSNGKGNGKTTTNPTNLTNALLNVNNNDVIMLVTTSTTDTYTENITFKLNDTIKKGTNTFSIQGQKNKNIIIKSFFDIEENLDISLGNLIFTDTGRIRCESSSLTVTNCTFKDISTYSGAIFNYGNPSNTKNNKGYISNNTFINCTAESSLFYSYAGAISNYVEKVIIADNIFYENLVPEYGGAVYTSGNNTTVSGNIFFHNGAYYGGALYNSGYCCNITNNTFTYNYAYELGGAINDEGENTSITHNIFKNNKAEEGAGAIYHTSCNTTIANNIFENNNADEGGAILSWGFNTNYLNNTFKNNSATYGGAISNDGNASNITKNTFTNNKATTIGGAIDNYENYTRYFGNTFINNSAPTGGAINGGHGSALSSKPLSNNNIINNTFTNNNASTGGAVRLYGISNALINNNTFQDNKADNSGGSLYLAAYIYYRTDYSGGRATSTYKITKGDNVTIDNNKFNNNSAEILGGAAYIKLENTTISNNAFKKNSANNGAAIYIWENSEDILVTKNKFTQNKASVKGTAIQTTEDIDIRNNINDKTSIYSDTIDNYGTDISITYNIFEDIISTKITVSPVKGVIGETITLHATLTDLDGNKISGGNLAFKLNGKTLRSDGRFDSNADAMKFSVKNGTVTYTINADLYLRNAKNLTASYSGTNTYAQNNSESVTAQIQKRNAQITVTATPKSGKQYDTLTFTVKATDTTKNGKNNTLISDNTKVMLKVNGVTLKDSKGKIVYVNLDKNAQATYKYTIPAGTGGITANKAVRNYSVTAIFVGENYYPGAKNSTYFNVERSATYVNITQAKVTKTNLLSVKATLKDYKGNNLIGTNKVTVKINGKSYTKNGKAVYWSVKNGDVNLSSIEVDPKTTIKRIMIVTGERQAYLEGRAETTNILRV